MAYGVRLPDRDERWFVKTAVDAEGLRSLERAWGFHRAVRHPVIVPQAHRIAVRDGSAQLAVPERATRPDPGERFAGVREFADAWLRAAGC